MSLDCLIVCGGRRTGTTLVAALLSTDPRTHPLGPEAQILTRLLETHRWGDRNFDAYGRFYFGSRERYREFFAETVDRFVRLVSEKVGARGLLVLKNPEISKVVLDLVALLPAAKVVACVRDPRDQVCSELEVGSRRVAAGIRDVKFERRDVVALAKLYASYYPEILTLRQRCPDRMMMLRYEDLVLRAEETIERLGNWAGFDLAMDPLDPWARVSPDADLHASPSTSDLYGMPVDSRSVGRFERDLSPEETIKVQESCDDLMKLFGYRRSLLDPMMSRNP